MKSRTAFAAALFAAALLMGAQQATAGVNVGDTAPDFELEETWNEPEGESLSELRGRLLLIEFWATW